jgi:hypothetical protein
MPAMNCTYEACKLLRTRLCLQVCNIQIVLALRHDCALRHAFVTDISERLEQDNGHAELPRVVFIDEDNFHASWKVSRHRISFRRSEKPRVVLGRCRFSYTVTYK